MSTIKTINLQHPSSASNNLVLDSSGNVTGAGTLAMASSFLRNRIINGDMRIDQRNAGASISGTDGAFPVDRFQSIASNGSKGNWQQNAGAVTPPSGFTNYVGFTTTSAYAVAAGDTYAMRHKVEGYNLADFGWGAAGAATVTLSFWVRSSLTGTFAGGLWNSAQNRSYVFTYTVNSANTWEYKTITISGDVTGTWLTNNGTGCGIDFSLGAGSTLQGTAGSWQAGYKTSASGAVSVVGTNGATFYLTGVQLEVGSVATPFERRQYGQELALCQRYYEAAGGDVYTGFSGSSVGSGTWSVRQYISFNVIKRAIPTMSYTNVRANWSAYNIALNLGGFSSECGTSTATTDPRPNFQWQANAEL